MIRARTLPRGPGSRRSRIGSTKAAVLPVPVWARPMTSLPCEDRRDRLNLDGGRGVVAERLDAGRDLRMKLERTETHGTFFLCDNR